MSWRFRSHLLSPDSILPSATRKRVSFGGPSTWRLHSNVPKYEVAGIPGGLPSRRHAAGCHLVQGRIRGRNQCGNSELSVLNGVSPFDTLILGMGNGHVHRGERVDAGGVSESLVCETGKATDCRGESRRQDPVPCLGTANSHAFAPQPIGRTYRLS